VVRAVQEALSQRIGRPLGTSVMSRINDALRQGVAVKLSGAEHDLASFEPVVISVIEDSLNRLVDGLRDAHEIVDLVVIVGGHPGHYRNLLTRRFPSIPIFVMPDSMYANVRGFQMIGEAESSVEATT
jgi:plasmid segregation protein ParM